MPDDLVAWFNDHRTAVAVVPIDGKGLAMKYPVTASTEMASAWTQCQMRTGASKTYTSPV